MQFLIELTGALVVKQTEGDHLNDHPLFHFMAE